MRILQIHNNHIVTGGAEVMLARTVEILERVGHHVTTYQRDNAEIVSFGSCVRAAFTGIYSFSARRDFGAVLDSTAPDVVHAHNLFPILSSSVLDACVSRRIPVVMRLADFSLICPAAHFFHGTSVCERCIGGREYHAVLKGCRGNVLRSTAYAARTMMVRSRDYLAGLVERFIAPSMFVRTKYEAAGVTARRIEVVANPVPIPLEPANPANGTYVGYAGRLSLEKGIDVLLRAAEISGLPVRIAGEPSPGFRLQTPAPPNVEFVGRLNGERLTSFYRGARIIAVPSLGLESFGLACAEAMAHGLPVVASRIGALPEVIGGEQNGVLTPPGEPEALAAAVAGLWNDPNTLKRIGSSAYQAAVSRFSPAVYCNELIRIYEAAIADREYAK